MYTNRISSKLPLFFYSFDQMRLRNGQHSEVHAVNKITIRNHENFASDGVEILIYNCALNKVPELCDGIRQTEIEKEDEKGIYFYGKGVSGNGISLSNRIGIFQCQNNMFELTVGKTDAAGTYHYLNYYKKFGDDFFSTSESKMKEYLRSIKRNIQSFSDDSSRMIWYVIMEHILSHYSWVYNWDRNDLPFISDDEWESKDSISATFDKIDLLKQFEELCDAGAYEAYQHYRNGDMELFQNTLNMMSIRLLTYYILYYSETEYPDFEHPDFF